MFPDRFFARRFFAPRFWPRNGGLIADIDPLQIMERGAAADTFRPAATGDALRPAATGDGFGHSGGRG